MARTRWDNTQSVYSGFLQSTKPRAALTAAVSAAVKAGPDDLDDWLLAFAQSGYSTIADALDATDSTLADLLKALSRLNEARLVEIEPTSGIIKVTDLGKRALGRRR